MSRCPPIRVGAEPPHGPAPELPGAPGWCWLPFPTLISESSPQISGPKGGSNVSAVVEHPITITQVPRGPVTEDDARALGLSYLRWVSACWRGDTLAPVFATQLGACWRSELAPKPTGRPDAISPHGGGGRGIHWYHTDEEVLGYVPGAAGGYQVPVAAIPQLVRCTQARPGTTQGSRDFRPGMLR